MLEQLEPDLNADPATEAEISEAWAEMATQFAEVADMADRAKGFLMASDGFPLWAIRRAARDFVLGEVKREGKRYPPRTHEYAQHVMAIYNSEMRKHRTEQELRDKAPPVEHVPITDKPDAYASRLDLVPKIGQDEFAKLVKQGCLPAGAIWTVRRGVVAPDGWRESDVNEWQSRGDEL